MTTERLLIMADTHLPKRGRDLPDELWRAVDDADVVIHAGDWIVPSLLDALEDRAKLLVGVYGNNDGAELRERLPEVARETIGGVRLAVVHETGPAAGRERRCQERFGDVDVLVFGHSHIPWDTTSNTGLRLLNPGSPTDRRKQPFCTYMTATADNGSLRDLRLHRLPPRTASKGAATPTASGRGVTSGGGANGAS
ncbi:MAG: metallophosphoesterase family protein [Nocardioidaceae bacterium]